MRVWGVNVNSLKQLWCVVSKNVSWADAFDGFIISEMLALALDRALADSIAYSSHIATQLKVPFFESSLVLPVETCLHNHTK